MATPQGAPHKICFVTIFNHKFLRNIPRLEALHQDRFSHRRYLVPFCTDDEKQAHPGATIISVYENSHQFQGYVTQALPQLLDPSFTHYVFVGDDVILNPAIHERNLVERLQMAPGHGYIKGMHPLATMNLRWPHLPGVFSAFQRRADVNWTSELPAPEEAEQRLRRAGVVHRPLRLSNLRGAPPWQHARNLLKAAPINYARLLRAIGQPSTMYPLVFSYSDVFVVPAEHVRRFAHLCGVLAAMRVFVEVAIPLAMALSCDGVTTERPGLRGQELWTRKEQEALVARHGGRLDALLADYPPEVLYIHPVKLSLWS